MKRVLILVLVLGTINIFGGKHRPRGMQRSWNSVAACMQGPATATATASEQIEPKPLTREEQRLRYEEELAAIRAEYTERVHGIQMKFEAPRNPQHKEKIITLFEAAKKSREEKNKQHTVTKTFKSIAANLADLKQYISTHESLKAVDTNIRNLINDILVVANKENKLKETIGLIVKTLPGSSIELSSSIIVTIKSIAAELAHIQKNRPETKAAAKKLQAQRVAALAAKRAPKGFFSSIFGR